MSTLCHRAPRPSRQHFEANRAFERGIISLFNSGGRRSGVVLLQSSKGLLQVMLGIRSSVEREFLKGNIENIFILN